MLGFAASIVGILLALYVPGYITFRSLRFSSLHAAVAAPLYSAMVYGMLPIAYYELGIRCTIISVVGPALLVAAACYGVSKILLSKSSATFGFPEPDLNSGEGYSMLGNWFDDGKLALAYLACGILVCIFVFGMNLPTPDAAYIRYDNQTHLNVSKAFLDSGMWSSLHPSRYLDLPLSARPVAGDSASFYPALLNALVALCALIGNVSATAAFNAVLFALCTVVFPLGMFGIMRVAFSGNRLAIALGAVASIAFAAFPWGVLVRGLFPNAAATCFMALAIASTMALVSQPIRKPILIRGIILWVCAMPTLALAQPNAVFAAFIFLVAYGAHVIGDRRSRLAGPEKSKQLRARILGSGAVLAIALIIWITCMNLPMMHSVVHYFGNTILDPTRTFLRVVLLKFDPFQRQIPLAIIVFVGAIVCAKRRMFWLLFPALWMALAYFIIRTQNNPLAHFLAGFWYCDHVRIAAVYSVFLMPLAAMGLCSVAHGAKCLCQKVLSPSSQTPQTACAGIVVALIIVAIFCPNISLPGQTGPQWETGFGTVYKALHNMYKITDDSVYGNDEQAFVDKAAEITGDELVLNYPADGSTFAYAVNGMKVYYRTIKVHSHNDNAKTIRLKLKDYSTDSKVQKAVESTGAKYLIKLDHGVSYEDGTWFRQFRGPQKYKGIEEVGDDTPGFTIVLSEGDMRLYRIDELE